MTEPTTDAFRTIGTADAVSDGSVVPFYLGDRKLRISVARAEGNVYAFDDICTCSDQGCPLSGGLLEGTALMCQCHGSRFDLATGAVLNGPATEALRTYAVDEAKKTVTFNIVASTYPNAAGTSQTRTIDKLTTDEFVNTNPGAARDGPARAANYYTRAKPIR